MNRFTILLCVFLGFSLSGYGAHAAAAGEESQTISYCIDPNWMPYEALRNGQHIGISADYLDIISKISGLNFRLVPTDSWQETIAYVESGTCMVTPMLNRTPSRSHFLYFSTPYIEVPNVIIGGEDTPMLQGFDAIGNRRVGIISGYRHSEYLARYYPDILTEYVNSEIEGLEKVVKGDIDVMVGSLMGVYSAINSHALTEVKIVGFAEPFDMLSFGINKNYEYLVPVLDDAIKRIPESRRVEIFKRWNAVRQVKQTTYGTVIVIGCMSIAVFALYNWRKRVLKEYQQQVTDKHDEIEALQSTLLEKNRTLEFLSTRDELTGLYNRNFLLQKCEEEISRFRRFQTPSSLIVITFVPEGKNRGLTASESLCKKLAAVCLSCVRDVDIAARGGQDRIAVLCPQTSRNGAVHLAERMLESLKSQTVLPRQQVFYIGVAEIQNGQSFSDWNDDVFRAVSASRRQGGNCIALSE